MKTSVSFRGKISGWWTGTRPSTGLDFGAELDVTQFFPDLKAQALSVTGTILGGVPITGVVDFDKRGLSNFKLTRGVLAIPEVIGKHY